MQTALRADPATGAVEFPGGDVCAAALGDVVYYVDVALGDDSNDGATAGAGAFATLEQAVAVAIQRDAMGHAITGWLADGNYALTSAIEINHPLSGTRALIFQGNSGDKSAVTLNGTGDLFVLENCRVQISDCSLTTSGSNNFLVVARNGTQVALEALVFGVAGKGHMDLTDAAINVNGACSIIGGALFHAGLIWGRVCRFLRITRWSARRISAACF